MYGAHGDAFLNHLFDLGWAPIICHVAELDCSHWEDFLAHTPSDPGGGSEPSLYVTQCPPDVSQIL